jgi:hypothetical protein
MTINNLKANPLQRNLIQVDCTIFIKNQNIGILT